MFHNKRKRDVTGITPSSVAKGAVDKSKRYSLRALLTHVRAMALMHLTNAARARCLCFEVNVQAPGG